MSTPNAHTCPVDEAAAHRWFAVECFNRCWTYIEMSERNPEQDAEMLRLTVASHWHWTQREDCQPVNLSIAHWQAARVYALIGDTTNARSHGMAALKLATDHDLGAFHLGYAHESLARAASIDADHDRAGHHIATARALLPDIEEEHDRNLLASDLEAISPEA